MMNITPMVRNLLIVNVVVFFLQSMLHITGDFALYHYGSDQFRPIQLFTHMFMHADFKHLFGNMFTLFMFGSLLERFWGHDRFLAFYLITGLGASLLYSGVRAYELNQMQQETIQYIESPSPEGLHRFLEEYIPGQYNKEVVAEYQRNPDDQSYINSGKKVVREVFDGFFNSPMLGASGAVFGLLMAFGMLFPNMELFLLFIPFPVKAKYLVFLLGVYELYTGFNRVQGDNVAHFAHLGGMLFAYILVKMWHRNNFRQN